MRRWDTVTWKLITNQPERFPDRFAIGVMYSPEGHCLTVTKPMEQLEVRDARVALQVHDLDMGDIVSTFEASQRTLFPNLSPDGKHVVIGVGAVEIFELATGKLAWYIHVFRASNTFVFDPQGKAVAVVDLAGKLTVSAWPEKGPHGDNRFVNATAHRRYALDVAFFPDGKQLATVGSDGMVRLWNATDGKEVDSLISGEDLSSLAVSPSGNQVAFASIFGDIGIWNLESNTRLRPRQQDANSWFGGLAVSRDGRWFAALQDMDSIAVWDLAARREVRKLSLDEPRTGTDVLSPLAFALSSDGQLVASGSGDFDRLESPGGVRVFESQSGKLRYTFPADKSAVQQITWSDNGKLLMWRSHDGTLQVWQWPEQRLAWMQSRQHLSNIVQRPGSAEFAIVTSNANGQEPVVEYVAASTGKVLRTYRPKLEYLTTISFSAEGKYALIGGLEQTQPPQSTLLLVDVPTGEVRQHFRGGDRPFRVSLSPNGKRVFAAYSNGNILVWDRETGAEIVSLRDGKVDLDDFRLTPDGKLIASAFQGGEIHVLDGSVLPKSLAEPTSK